MENPFATMDERLGRLEANQAKILALLNELHKQSTEKFLSQHETRKLFVPEMPRTTFHRYEKKGLLKKYLIDGKPVYKLSEIIEAAKVYSIKKPQHKNAVA